MCEYKNGEYILLLKRSCAMPPGIYKFEKSFRNQLVVTLEEQREYFRPQSGYIIELSKTVPITKAVKVLYGDDNNVKI